MPRIAYVILCSCLLAFASVAASPANAGNRDYGYRGDRYDVDVAYPPPRPSRVWYSSRCCYMKIVRHVGHERQVRYVKVRPSRIKRAVLEQRRDRVARRNWRRERISRRDRPRRYAEYKVIVVPRDGGRDRCRRKRVRVLAAGGGWVWAVKARCY